MKSRPQLARRNSTNVTPGKKPFTAREDPLRTEDDIAACLSLPVLGRVPLMTTSDERRRAKRARLLLLGSAVAFVIVSLAAAAWRFGWFR